MSSMTTMTNGGHYDSGGQKKHLPILKWLQVIDMDQYVTLFYQYAGVEVSTKHLCIHWCNLSLGGGYALPCSPLCSFLNSAPALC